MIVEAQNSGYWYGPLPDEATMLPEGWSYIESKSNYLKAIRLSDGKIFYANPDGRIVGEVKDHQPDKPNQ